MSQLEDGEKNDETMPSLNVDMLKRQGKQMERGYGLARESSQNRILLPLPKASLVYRRRRGKD